MEIVEENSLVNDNNDDENDENDNAENVENEMLKDVKIQMKVKKAKVKTMKRFSGITVQLECDLFSDEDEESNNESDESND